MRRALTIAGSDSGGGAGIQADLKTFTAFQVYGMSVITAVTAQNTMGVQYIHPMPPEFVVAQLQSVLSDIGADTVKTGMLATREIVELVSQVLDEFQIKKVVVDPVMIAHTGTRLLEEGALESIRDLLLPLAKVVTPNIGEASVLCGERVEDVPGMREAAKRIREMGPEYVLIKGGHLAGPRAIDIFYDGIRFEVKDNPRVPTNNTHGAGCTLSAAIAAGLAKGQDVKEAVEIAHRYTFTAIRSSFALGKGRGPVNHFVKP